MKISCMLSLCLFFLCNFCSAQNNGFISIHSISTTRQPLGDHGYTLDGQRMESTSRAKLINPLNFGDTGPYSKLVVIWDAYATENALLDISSTSEIIDIFYFGSFNKLDTSLEPFSEAEIDSLYTWSEKGGKLIISGSSSIIDSSLGLYFDPSILNSRWGFEIDTIVGPAETTLYLPTQEGTESAIFNGPFGEITMANQGGYAQGFFSSFPQNSLVLAENQDEQPTLILDCNTLDLILADWRRA